MYHSMSTAWLYHEQHKREFVSRPSRPPRLLSCPLCTVKSYAPGIYPGAIFAEQHGAKRRRLSRQFSVSEKGSPVVVNDAILPENIQPVVDKDEQLAKPFCLVGCWFDHDQHPTTNNTRRSSPADLGELSNDDVWDFEEPFLDLYHPPCAR